MPQLKPYLTILLLSLPFFCIAQNDGQPGQEVGFTAFTWETNPETKNAPLALKFLPGIYYARHFKNWVWINNFQLGHNQIDDNCTSCADQFHGTGKMKEWMASSSFRRYFFQRHEFSVKPFLEPGVFFSHLRYSGDFDGGFDGQGTLFDDTHWAIGTITRFGFMYRPYHRFALSAYTSFLIGIGKYHDNIQEDDSRRYVLKNSMLQLSAGYVF